MAGANRPNPPSHQGDFCFSEPGSPSENAGQTERPPFDGSGERLHPVRGVRRRRIELQPGGRRFSNYLKTWFDGSDFIPQLVGVEEAGPVEGSVKL